MCNYNEKVVKEKEVEDKINRLRELSYQPQIDSAAKNEELIHMIREAKYYM